MNTRIDTLHSIRCALEVGGPDNAALVAREALESGRLDALDAPEVFLALRAGSLRFIDALAGRAPGCLAFQVFSA